MGCTYNSNGPTSTIYTDLKNEKIVEEIYNHLYQNENDIASRYELVKIFISEYFFKKAINELKTIIHIDPEEILAYQLLAFTFIKSEKTDYINAVKTLEKAVKISPKNVRVRIHLASLYSELGMNDSAIKECNNVLNLKMDLSQMATVYLILASVDKVNAEKHYQTAQRLDPEITKSNNTIIQVPFYTGKTSIFHYSTHPESNLRINNLDALSR